MVQISPAPVDGALSFVLATWDNFQQDTTTAKRPRINGAPTPNRGLADRKDTTD